MKVSELISLLTSMNQDADVMFDTEAQTYDVHLVPVDSAYAEGPEAGLDREIVYLCEDAPHRTYADPSDREVQEERAAAREAGAREFAEWLDAEHDSGINTVWVRYPDVPGGRAICAVRDAARRFLASRGTAAKKEKEGE